MAVAAEPFMCMQFKLILFVFRYNGARSADYFCRKNVSIDTTRTDNLARLFGMHAAFLMPFSMHMQQAMPRARILSASETVPALSPAWQQPARRHRCTQHACLCMHSFLDDM